MRTLAILFALLFASKSIACPAYQLVKAGDPTPCQGVFLNQSTNDRVKRDLTDNEIRKKQIELKDLQIQELSTDRENWKVEAEKQAKISRSKDSDMKKGAAAGVIMTLVAIFLIRQVDK
jgi:hypothetical protein